MHTNIINSFTNLRQSDQYSKIRGRLKEMSNRLRHCLKQLNMRTPVNQLDNNLCRNSRSLTTVNLKKSKNKDPNPKIITYRAK